MSAHDQIRAMLDELMGTGRDGENNKYKVRFDDPRVCRSFLLSCCPHDILASTRMDLGECPKIHDLALRADYETAQALKDYYFDIDAMEHLQSFVADCDRRTEQAARRLKETQEELSEEANGKAEVIHQLGEQIGTKLAKAEQAGAEGHVEESLKLMAEIEDLKKMKGSAEMDFRNSMPASSYQQQKLRVCEICSAYLGIHDNDRRLADHFGGKLHLGFITIREKLEELKKSVADRREQREKEREERRRDREEKEKEELEQREKEREKQRRRSRSQSRGGGGSGSARRSRSKERRRSRSRSRDRRRRERSNSRNRSRRHRSRSRSRDRRRRSRSRDRRRRRSRSRSPRRVKRSRSRERSRHSDGSGAADVTSSPAAVQPEEPISE
ncbi:putative RNA-binding protein Luc7-like 1 isoform X2 [Tubulanus polymorphus]